jgi:YidC/Oxa1 family membrane protein insertase
MFEFFNIILIKPIFNILVAIYQLLLAVNIPYALGFAIIALTVLVRLIIHPSMQKGMKQQKKMQELAPHIAKIKEKHKGDIQRQNMAQAELFKEHGVNPLSGCLPLLLQFPLIIGLFQALTLISQSNSLDKINNQLYSFLPRLTNIWDTDFFGFPLDKSPNQFFSTMAVAVVLLVVVSALLQYVQAKMIAPIPTDAVEKKSDKPDMASMIQSNMMLFLPVIVGISAYTLPVGVSLYWNTFSIFAIIQQYRSGGWGGLTTVLRKFKK